MNKPTHLCLDCELASRESFVTLRTDGGCETCGSKSVLDLLIAKAALAPTRTQLPSAARRDGLGVATQALENVVRETSVAKLDALAAQRSFRLEQSKAKRNEFNQPIRAFLLRAKLDAVNAWWDGWGAWEHTSFWARGENAVAETESDWVKLELCNLNGDSKWLTFHFDPTDEASLVVEEILKNRKTKP